MAKENGVLFNFVLTVKGRWKQIMRVKKYFLLWKQNNATREIEKWVGEKKRKRETESDTDTNQDRKNDNKSYIFHQS